METILLAVSISCLVSVVTNLISVITVLVLAKKSKTPTGVNDEAIRAELEKLDTAKKKLEGDVERNTPK